MAVVKEYLDARGRSPFARWLDGIDAVAAARVTTTLIRIGLGNFSSVKGVGAGVFESRIDVGPGYRVYFGKDGPTLVILLGGGTKKRQREDIRRAQQLWAEYTRHKENDDGADA